MRDVPREDVFRLAAFAAAASEFCEWVQVGIDISPIVSATSSLTHLLGFQLLLLLP